MSVVTVEDVNNFWTVERVIELLDQSRTEDAQAIAQEWHLAWDATDEF